MTLLRADKEKSLLQRRDTKPQVDLIRIILVTCWMSCLGDRALANKKIPYTHFKLLEKNV